MINKNNSSVELTLSKIVIVVLLLTALMSVFLYYFFSQEKEIESTALRSIAASFVTQTSVVRSQWLMDKKPNKVVLNLNDGQKLANRISISVNSKGWIDVDNSNNSSINVCEQIWLMIMDKPLDFFKMPIGAVLLNKNRENSSHICRYVVKNGDYFEYNSANGKVSEVLNDK